MVPEESSWLRPLANQGHLVRTSVLHIRCSSWLARARFVHARWCAPVRVITWRYCARTGDRRYVCSVEKDVVRSTVFSSLVDFFGYWMLSREQIVGRRGGQGLGAQDACILRAGTRLLAVTTYAKKDLALVTASCSAACGNITLHGGTARNSSHRRRSSALALRMSARFFGKYGWRASRWEPHATAHGWFLNTVPRESVRRSFKDRSLKQLFAQHISIPRVSLIDFNLHWWCSPERRF